MMRYTRKHNPLLMTAILALLVTISIPTGEHSRSPLTPAFKSALAQTSTRNDIKQLTGRWKVVRATLTPEFLNIPIPISSIDATGSISHDKSYEIKASGALFGSNYDYLGKGTLELQGSTVILTVQEGAITIDDQNTKYDRKGKIIRGTYRISTNGTMFMKTVKENNGVRYTLDLELVNT
ncbi:MAG: hypothetical protein C1942_09590 [Prosthecochloris sp.]|uniref:hypothetical protein n=1 Tax=Prosthecochloris sp. TaxID=290513 RepID=UPI0013CA9E6A|nr:hypothetical protein [Prosthecochloris sp.]NEX12916.1 hypothetical protein [Prosthecochloris sp.]